MTTETPTKRRPGRPAGSGQPPGGTKQLNVRIPLALLARLQQKAIDEDRPISAQVVYLLRQALEH